MDSRHPLVRVVRHIGSGLFPNESARISGEKRVASIVRGGIGIAQRRRKGSISCATTRRAEWSTGQARGEGCLASFLQSSKITNWPATPPLFDKRVVSL